VEELDFELDASSYVEVTNEYEIEFKNLILNIYSCYLLMLSDKKLVPKNSENSIRDMLLKSLKDTKIRNEDCLITGYRFDKEVDESEGRVDIKIIDINDFEKYEAYYIIECKRLDGTKRLNNAYVNDGIKHKL